LKEPPACLAEVLIFTCELKSDFQGQRKYFSGKGSISQARKVFLYSDSLSNANLPVIIFLCDWQMASALQGSEEKEIIKKEA
jgi:hypothetical protein